MIPIGFTLLYHPNEVVGLQYSFNWIRFDNVAANLLLVGQDLVGDKVPDINDALFTLLSIIIKENVLTPGVRLINEQQFGAFTMEVILFPVKVILLHGHSSLDLERFLNMFELIADVCDQFAILVLRVTSFQAVTRVFEVRRQSSGQACDHFDILKLTRESVVDSCLTRIIDSHVPRTI